MIMEMLLGVGVFCLLVGYVRISRAQGHTGRLLGSALFIIGLLDIGWAVTHLSF
jgi:hypothetical protein